MKTILYSLLFIFSLSSFSQNSEIILTDYIREIQIWNKGDDKMALTFWIPNGYWRIAIEGNKDVPASASDYIEEIFEDYVVICALDVKIGIYESFTYTSESDLRKSIFIKDENGQKHYPLKDELISEEALTLTNTVKPMFNKMLGEMGQGMHFFMFKIKDKTNENLIDENKPGHFAVHHSDYSFEYNLPLVILMPPKFCPKDKEKMKGNWKFCPIHGVELVDSNE